MRPQEVVDAARWIQRIAQEKGQMLPGGLLGKGWASYTEFCLNFKLGNPHNNNYMNALLLNVMEMCKKNGWPDLAALVIHDDQNGTNEGPGKGWYEMHQYWPGDLRRWKSHRDDCWARSFSFSIP